VRKPQLATVRESSVGQTIRKWLVLTHVPLEQGHQQAAE
jgi:hypothetical protein